MAETNGLLNRRTGKSGTEGSNPSVSATHSIISKTCVETVGLPTFLPTFKCGLTADCFAPRKHPHPFKNLPNRDPTGVAPPILADGTHSSFLHTILRVWLARFHSQLKASHPGDVHASAGELEH